jgi:hypothetical protein
VRGAICADRLIEVGMCLQELTGLSVAAAVAEVRAWNFAKNRHAFSLVTWRIGQNVLSNLCLG